MLEFVEQRFFLGRHSSEIVGDINPLLAGESHGVTVFD